MEFNWSTFVLEAINFAVLIWLLKRVLYKPVLNVMRERQKNIQESLAQAAQQKQEAQALQEKYNHRLQEWEKEKADKTKIFQEGLDQEKIRQEEKLALSLQKEREKNRVIEEKRMAELLKNSQSEGVQLGAEFSSRLLKTLSGPETETKIIELFLKDLPGLSPEYLHKLKNGFTLGRPVPVKIKSAYPLADSQKEKIEQALNALFEAKPNLQFSEDKDLIAGLTVNAGGLVLQANLRDELSFFTQVGRHGE